MNSRSETQLVAATLKHAAKMCSRLQTAAQCKEALNLLGSFVEQGDVDLSELTGDARA